MFKFSWFSTPHGRAHWWYTPQSLAFIFTTHKYSNAVAKSEGNASAFSFLRFHYDAFCPSLTKHAKSGKSRNWRRDWRSNFQSLIHLVSQHLHYSIKKKKWTKSKCTTAWNTLVIMITIIIIIICPLWWIIGMWNEVQEFHV